MQTDSLASLNALDALLWEEALGGHAPFSLGEALERAYGDRPSTS